VPELWQVLRHLRAHRTARLAVDLICQGAVDEPYGFRQDFLTAVVSAGYPLNAFNATGAFLTNLIPGYQFDFAVMQRGSDDACPIDHFGNFKN
jgi:hypothetical protein